MSDLRDNRGILTPAALAAAKEAGARLSSLAGTVSDRARRAIDDASKAQHMRAEEVARLKAQAASRQPSGKQTQPETGPDSRFHVDEYGLHIRTEHLRNWPPKTRNEEVAAIKLYLNEYYERRRRRIEDKRKESHELILKEKQRATDSRSTLLVFAGVCALVGLMLLATVGGLGILGMLIGFGFVVAAFASGPGAHSLADEDHPSVAELEAIYDRIMNEEMHRLWNSGNRMLGLDKVGPQEFFLGPYLNFPDLSEVGDAWVGARRGSDGVPRFTPRSIYFLSFHSDQIVSYESATDLIRGAPIVQKIREFSYQDVTSITRTQQTLSFRRRKSESADGTAERPGRATPEAAPLLQASNIQLGLPPATEALTEVDVHVSVREILRLDLVNGNPISIILNDRYLSSASADTDMPSNDSDRVVELIRSQVRSKKNALARPGQAPPPSPQSPYGAAFGR